MSEVNIASDASFYYLEKLNCKFFEKSFFGMNDLFHRKCGCPSNLCWNAASMATCI